jgi:DNA-binding NarL/FixJ family response regulator
LTSYVDTDPDLVVLKPEHWADADVVVVETDRLRPDLIACLRDRASGAAKPVVLIVSELSDTELLTAISCRVVVVLPRRALDAERLVRSVRTAAAGGGVMPPSLLGDLVKHVERLQREVLAPQGLNPSGLSSREVDVLQLLAEGLDTAEIGDRLCYSERTVKNVLYRLNHRLNLRSRSHAIAYAMRAGAI